MKNVKEILSLLIILISICACEVEEEAAASEDEPTQVSTPTDCDAQQRVTSDSDNNEVYLVVPYNELTNGMLDACTQTSYATLRHTVTGQDLVILSYITARPDVFYEDDNCGYYDEYTRLEMLTLLNTEPWDPCFNSSCI